MSAVTRPYLLVQLSDPHIGAEWADGDSVDGLAAAVGCVLRLQPDAVLVSGDLSDHASDAEYDLVRNLLAPLEAPLYVLAGNHDDRSALRRHFGVPGADDEPVRYSVELGPMRLVVLDTAQRGNDPGALGAGQLEWLDAELAATPGLPTLVAMHHPPFATGVAAWDGIGLPDADRRALGEVIERHPQVRRLVSGHLHRTINGAIGGRPALVVPSTFVQARLTFDSDEIELAAEPAGFAVHAVVDGELISHVQPVDEPGRSRITGGADVSVAPRSR
jgi:3',5'-cyclic-AMP phosphodiesterase